MIVGAGYKLDESELALDRLAREEAFLLPLLEWEWCLVTAARADKSTKERMLTLTTTDFLRLFRKRKCAKRKR